MDAKLLKEESERDYGGREGGGEGEGVSELGEGGMREEGGMGVSEGFMSVIMESQWLGHWHWGIFSHPPPIIRWMDQEGVSTATYGWERMAGCCVGAQITYSDRFAFISSRHPYTSSYIKWVLGSISHNLMVWLQKCVQITFIIWYFIFLQTLSLQARYE